MKGLTCFYGAGEAANEEMEGDEGKDIIVVRILESVIWDGIQNTRVGLKAKREII